MSNVLGAAIGAVSGGILGAAGGYYQAKQSQASAKAQMEFQRHMSNTSYQRAMRDMRTAGLNPMLAAKVGGASTPQGAGYQTPNIGVAATQGAHSAMQAANLYQQNQVLQKQATAAGIENDFLLKEPWAVPAKMLQGMSPLEIAAFKTWWQSTQQNDAKISLKDALSGALDTTPPGKGDKYKPLEIEIKGDRNNPYDYSKKKLTRKQIREKIERETKGMNHSEKMYYFKNHPNWRY